MASGLFDEQLYLSVNIDHLLMWKIITWREGILEHDVLIRQDIISCLACATHTHTHVRTHSE